MRIRKLHDWPTDARAAVALQKRLAPRVRLTALPTRLRLIAGTDVAFSRYGRRVIAGVVLWDLKTGQVLETHVATVACTFPYVPGLLSFRELPGLLEALRALRHRPDAVLCDAQGIAHPRRLGLATHLGLWLGLPTVGCAKSRLCGMHDEVGAEKGARAALWDGDERLGVVLRTRTGVKPLYVSPGHLCDLDGAAELTLRCATRYRLPEPTRLAHLLVSRAR